MEVGAVEIKHDARNVIDLRSVDDAEAVLKATHMEDDTPAKYIVSQVTIFFIGVSFSICVDLGC